MPFLAKFLAGRGWRDDAIQFAAAFAGLGVILMQTPAGPIVDRVRQRRTLLAGAALLLGICYGLLPGQGWVIDTLLLTAGTARRFSCRCWERWRWPWSATSPFPG